MKCELYVRDCRTDRWSTSKFSKVKANGPPDILTDMYNLLYVICINLCSRHSTKSGFAFWIEVSFSYKCGLKIQKLRRPCGLIQSQGCLVRTNVMCMRSNIRVLFPSAPPLWWHSVVWQLVQVAHRSTALILAPKNTFLHIFLCNI